MTLCREFMYMFVVHRRQCVRRVASGKEEREEDSMGAPCTFRTLSVPSLLFLCLPTVVVGGGSLDPRTDLSRGKSSRSRHLLVASTVFDRPLPFPAHRQDTYLPTYLRPRCSSSTSPSPACSPQQSQCHILKHTRLQPTLLLTATLPNHIHH